MRNATLVFSVKPGTTGFLVATFFNPSSDNLMNAIFKRRTVRPARFIKRNGQLVYFYSNEYKEFVVRMKKIK